MGELLTDMSLLLPLVGIGLLAGVLGGMLGVGGSVIMIPGMVILLGQNRAGMNLHLNQHLYQAAAMMVNVAVSIPAARRHHRAGAVVPKALKTMMPAAMVFVLVGVWLSNRAVFQGTEGSVWLGRLLAIFLVYVVMMNISRLRTGHEQKELTATQIITPLRCGVLGSLMGTIAGLLGIGGGAFVVPMQQLVLRLPLRSCIANSSVIICVSAGIGATYKCATLSGHGLDWKVCLLLAAALAPSAWIGGRIGASLTHRLPLRQVRIAVILLMIVAGVRMADLPWSRLTAWIGS